MIKMKHVFTGIVGSSLLAGAIGASAAEKIAPKTLEFLEATEVSGYVQTSYQRAWNTENGSPGLVPARGFNNNRNSFDVDQVKITLEKPLGDGDYAAGYRVDLLFGSNAALIHSSTHSPSGDENSFSLGNNGDLEQAYVQFRLPVGNGVEVKFGKFVTLAGMEVIDAPANWNYSHSYNFLYAIPFTHTGALMSYKFNDHIDAQLGVVNGWDQTEDNNSFKTLMGRLGVTLMGGKLVFSTVAIGGPERAVTGGGGFGSVSGGNNPINGNDEDYRWILDETITWTINEKVSVGIDGVYGEERFGSHSSTGQSPAKDCHWWGVAGYAKVQWTPHVSTAARAEYFSDDGGSRLLNGSVPGVGTSSSSSSGSSFAFLGQTADVQEYTLSAQLDNVWKNLTPRLELRYDHINHAILGGTTTTTFDDSSQTTDTHNPQQSVFSVSLDFIYTF